MGLALEDFNELYMYKNINLQSGFNAKQCLRQIGQTSLTPIVVETRALKFIDTADANRESNQLNKNKTSKRNISTADKC